jgi:hypothetical protein
VPEPRDPVDFEHPANADVLTWLAASERLPAYLRSGPPGSVDPWQLGTHPDLVETLWQRLDRALPVRCGWIVHGRPTLVHPLSGVVFAFASGTRDPALRVPPVPSLPAVPSGESGSDGPARRDGAAFERHPCGTAWIFAPHGPAQVDRTLAAFEAAAALVRGR